MTVREKIALFPHSPGVYRYYNSEGIVIYVGKAKDLHKRVAQYFVSPDRLNAKTRILVSKIADAQYSVVDSEADALLLENNLISSTAEVQYTTEGLQDLSMDMRHLGRISENIPYAPNREGEPLFRPLQFGDSCEESAGVHFGEL